VAEPTFYFLFFKKYQNIKKNMRATCYNFNGATYH